MCVPILFKLFIDIITLWRWYVGKWKKLGFSTFFDFVNLRKAIEKREIGYIKVGCMLLLLNYWEH